MTVSNNSGSQVSLGVSPLSWTNDVLAELGGDIPLEVCLKDAADNGYDGVELGRKFPRGADELLSKLSSYGLRLATGWHSGFLTERSVEVEWKAAADHVQLLERCGCQVLVYGEILRRFGNRVVHIHLKDVRGRVLDWAHKNDVTFNSGVREGLFTVPGDGNVDFTEMGKFVRSSGYSGWVVVEAEQDPAKAAPRIYAEKAYQYVKNLLF